MDPSSIFVPFDARFLGKRRAFLTLPAAINVAMLAAMLAISPAALAQTTTAGKVTGTVTDATGGVVPKAEVQLENVDTGTVLNTVSDDTGGFLFPVVNAGKYRVSVKAAGFRTAVIQDVTVNVEKTSPLQVKLEVGADKEVVEVRATAVAQLQTTDAQIGNVLETDNILHLPALQRNAIELVSLQPGVVSTGGAGLAMRVSGAIDDQNTVTVDGIDITQNIVATGTSIPTPDDSVEEFRVNVANPSATLMRASGAQVTLIGRRGNNDLHGALYEYLQNNDLNANTWDNNRAHLNKAVVHDNRFGARVGGPIKKNKTFIFGNYEARRFESVAQVTRTVPTATLRQGIVQFQGPGGLEKFDLKTAAICAAPAGASGTTACDPRGLGMNPSVAAQFADMPLPNLTGGDGLNTGSYFANLPTPTSTDYGVIRLDHTVSEKLSLNATFTYYRSDQVASADISILNGSPASAETTPQRGILPSLQATWQINPTLVNVARIGWVRDTSQTNATSPTKAAGILNIPGSQTGAGPVALAIGSGVSTFIDSPIDMDTQRARFQAAWSQFGQIYDDVTKVWGKHNLQFGMQLNKINFTHARADKVLGSITSLVAQIDGDQTYLTIPTVNEPAVCSGSITSNCVPSSQLTNWDRYYSSLLGLVDNVGVLAVRNQNLQPQPLGTILRDVTNQYATYFYAQDSFRIKPSLTLYYGLSWGWQTAPTEQHNLQTIMINAADNSLVTAGFLQQKMNAALSGQILNPTFGFETVGTARRPVYDTDYGNVAPRIALAWNPSASSGIWQSILGQNKTVIRGGFGMVYDRSNTVQSVEIPMLGIGFDQNIFVAAPACNATGAGGAGCNPSAGVSVNPGLGSFRVGTDGTLPLPTATAASSPIIPAVAAETLSFQVDPRTKIGRSYNFDFTLQRELPGGIVMEAAYIGREARDLPQAVNVNSAPYMFVDSASKQSFAQAYDLIADALRAGQTAPVEPFFENQFPGLAALKKSTSATAYIVSANKSLFTGGSVGNLFLNLDNYRRQLGLQAYDSDQAQVEFLRTYIGYSNYNAGAITFTKRMSHGLSISGNYTYSKALDDGLSNQNNAGFFSNSYNPSVQYGPSGYDRHHVVNAYYEYDVPLGRGHLLDGGKAFNWLIGGWYTSGIFSAWSGVPVKVSESGQVWGGGTSVIGGTDYAVPVGPLPATGLNHHVSNNTTCSTSFFNGTVATNVGGSSGTNMDLFSNPGAAYCDFNYVQLSTDGRTGSANPVYGLPFWNLDMRLAKNTKITEKFNTVFSADFFNVFNHENFSNPGLSISSPATFGAITSTFTPANRTNSARWIEMGLRLEF